MTKKRIMFLTIAVLCDFTPRFSLPEQLAEAITQALEKQVQDFTYDPDDNPDGWFNAVDKLPELIERFKRIHPVFCRIPCTL